MVGPGPMSRVGILSDVHGNVFALEAVLEDARRQGCETLVVAGDLVAQGPAPAETLDLLREIEALVLIRGNTDRYLSGDGPDPAGRDPEVLASLAWTRAELGEEATGMLGALPTQAVFDVGLVLHASPEGDEIGIWPEVGDEKLGSWSWEGVLACGHTHRPMLRDLGSRQVVNVGSVGWPLDGDPRPSYAVVAVDPGHPERRRVELRRVDYDRSRALAELERRAVPWRHAVRHYIETATWRSPARYERSWS